MLYIHVMLLKRKEPRNFDSHFIWSGFEELNPNKPIRNYHNKNKKAKQKERIFISILTLKLA